MISKSKIKFIKSLQVKKYRKKEQSFTVEGLKGVQELLQSDFEIIFLAATSQFLTDYYQILRNKNIEFVETTESELSSVGIFSSNNSVLAIARIQQQKIPKISSNQFMLALDDIRDPGNLGTIIRTADWYGISDIVASLDTADFYNPKVITASMGSFCRVNVYYTELERYLSQLDVPIYGASLSGESLYNTTFSSKGVIIIGNESFGISNQVDRLVQHRITIPRIGGAESLNASIATAIILDNLFRMRN